MNRWHLRKADLCWPVRKSAVSQWSRVKRGMKACEWASASARVPLYSLGCQFTSKPSHSPRLASLVWKGCCFGCRAPTTTYRQTEWVWDLPDESAFSTNTHQALSASPLLTQCPFYELCWIKFGGKKNRQIKATTAYLFGGAEYSNEAVWYIT